MERTDAIVPSQWLLPQGRRGGAVILQRQIRNGFRSSEPNSPVPLNQGRKYIDPGACLLLSLPVRTNAKELWEVGRH